MGYIKINICNIKNPEYWATKIGDDKASDQLLKTSKIQCIAPNTRQALMSWYMINQNIGSMDELVVDNSELFHSLIMGLWERTYNVTPDIEIIEKVIRPEAKLKSFDMTKDDIRDLAILLWLEDMGEIEWIK